MPQNIRKLEFKGHSGATLAARLDSPTGPIRAYALFARCVQSKSGAFGTSGISGLDAAHYVSLPA